MAASSSKKASVPEAKEAMSRFIVVSPLCQFLPTEGL